MPARPLRLLAASALVAGSAVAAPAAGEQSAIDKTIFLSVVDDGGKPITDLKLGEILIREDGIDREVVSVGPAKEALFVALLVDTTPAAAPYIRDIRTGLASFAREIRAGNQEARISVTEFGQAAVPIVPFTTDAERLDREITRIYPKQDAPSVLLEALLDACNSLARQQSSRRAIVVFNMEGTVEGSREEPAKIQEAMKRAGAQLWVLSLQKQRPRQESLSPRDIVLNVLTKNTGGSREFINSEAAIELWMQRYAAALAAQYAVTFKRPSSDRPKVVQTGIARSGSLKLHASLFAPQ
jgi:hypothetical protein